MAIYKTKLERPTKQDYQESELFLEQELKQGKSWMINNTNRKESQEQQRKRIIRSLAYERQAGRTLGIEWASTAVWNDCQHHCDYVLSKKLIFETKLGKFFDSDWELSCTLSQQQKEKIEKYKANVLLIDPDNDILYIIGFPSFISLLGRPQDATTSSAKYRIALDVREAFEPWKFGKLSSRESKCEIKEFSRGSDYFNS